MKLHPCFSIFLFSLFIGILVLPAPAEAQPYGLVFGDFAERILHTIKAPQHKWQEVSDQYLAEGDECRTNCEKYSNLLRNRLVDLYNNDKSIIIKGSLVHDQPVPNQDTYLSKDSDAKFYENTRDYWCGCAKANYDMAIETSPGNDLSHQSVLYQRAALVYGAMGNKEQQEQATQKAEVLAQAAQTKFELSIPPWIPVFALLAAILVIIRKRACKK
jgi:hypothetical protein